MAAWLVNQGHEVRVVTAPPDYPAWAVRAGYFASTGPNEKTYGLHVWRCPQWVPAKPGGASRLMHLASFALCSLPVMLRQIFWRRDVVWVPGVDLIKEYTQTLDTTLKQLRKLKYGQWRTVATHTGSHDDIER